MTSLGGIFKIKEFYISVNSGTGILVRLPDRVLDNYSNSRQFNTWGAAQTTVSGFSCNTSSDSNVCTGL